MPDSGGKIFSSEGPMRSTMVLLDTGSSADTYTQVGRPHIGLHPIQTPRPDPLY